MWCVPRAAQRKIPICQYEFDIGLGIVDALVRDFDDIALSTVVAARIG